MLKKTGIALAVLLGLGAIYLLAWPVGVDPLAWDPPKAPELAGVYAPNQRLAQVVRLAPGAGKAPESVALDSRGRVHGGYEDGRIIRAAPDGGAPVTLARTGGRPLGMVFDPKDNLLVCDPLKGLLRISPEGKVSVLAREAGGRPLGAINDLDLGRDGKIYFSETTHRGGDAAGSETTYLEIFEHRPNGRLLRCDPGSGEVEVLLKEIHYANGVALSPDGSFVLVSETTAYRIRRLWLSGPDKGRDDIFIDNLPGFPDGISLGSDGLFWLTLVNPRNGLADEVLMPNPFLRKVFLRLPRSMVPQPQRYGFVLALDEKGRVRENLQDPGGGSGRISCVVERAGRLYLGSLAEDSMGLVKLRP